MTASTIRPGTGVVRRSFDRAATPPAHSTGAFIGLPLAGCAGSRSYA